MASAASWVGWTSCRMRPVAAGSLSYALFIATLLCTSIHVNHAVTEPYLDEPFHVGQTQTYCRGQWRQWDPKITTPPGVYVFFVAAHCILGLPCQVAPMRQWNTVLLALLPLVFYDLLRRIRGTGGLGAWIEALGLASFPLVFFFAFLFYTDVASLFVVLLSYDAALAQRYVLSSLMGVLSLGFRQTNVLWIAFVGLDGLLRELEAKGLRNPPLARGFAPLGSTPLAFLSHAATHWRTTTRLFVTYAPVAAAFALFLLWNQGIVLGDKGNHAAALHLPQLLYLLACVLFFGWPVLASVKNLQRATRARFGSVAFVQGAFADYV